MCSVQYLALPSPSRYQPIPTTYVRNTLQAHTLTDVQYFSRPDDEDSPVRLSSPAAPRRLNTQQLYYSMTDRLDHRPRIHASELRTERSPHAKYEHHSHMS